MSHDGPEGDASDEREAGATPTADELFAALARAANRYVLQYLLDSDRPVSVDELVEYAVGVAEAERTVGELRGGVRESVERAVVDLEKGGFLRHDRHSHAVEATERAAAAGPHLDLARERLDTPNRG
jgi:hypothetical protein